MFIRIVAHVLIAAVAACPLRCSESACLVGGCCTETSGNACLVHGTADDCCAETQPETGERGPRRCPSETSCQGICGGAVFEKQIEIEDPSGSFFSPVQDKDTSLITRLTVGSTHDGASYLRHFPGGNHGRSLRTLHMSFLC